VTAPPRLTGDIRLVDDSLDPARWPRHEWLFQTGQRRARRVPASAYDQSDPASPGACTSDERDLFNGGLDRYDWKLLGKREVFVPYNAYCLHEARVKYAELLSPHHLNPDLLRYELHRVWVVEAALKPGFRHLYPRRTFYVDEDSWQILCADAYDAAGKVWRVAEAHGINYYDVPAFWGSIEVHLDLVSGRYVVAGLASGQPPPHFNTGLTARDFTVGSLRAASATVEDEP
jgi:hypothetical protein